MLSVIVLAAGDSKRMKSDTPKFLHALMGKTILDRVIDSFSTLESKDIVLVVGNSKEKVIKRYGDRFKYAFQEQRLGTGHATLIGLDMVEQDSRHTLIMTGDTPLLTQASLEKLHKEHVNSKNALTVLTAEVDNPFGYGRIVRNLAGKISSIVEQKDADEETSLIREINSGIMMVKTKYLREYLHQIQNNNSQGEYYLTDLLGLLIANMERVGSADVPFQEILGVNDRVQLHEARDVLAERLNTKLQRDGVTLIDPKSTYIDDTVSIGRDTTIYPGVIIEGETVIGSNTVIGGHTHIIDSRIGDYVNIDSSRIKGALIYERCSIGPFAYLRPGTVLKENVKIGDFVEVKNSVLGANSKASHLSYIGDADLGENINVGCGAIFVNYDGVNKHRSNIGDGAFIGCNSNLISPVKIGKDSYVAAGSTITHEVPEQSLAIARARQTVKEGWKLKSQNK